MPRPLQIACAFLILVVLSPTLLLAAKQRMYLDTKPLGVRVEQGGTYLGTTPMFLEFPETHFRAPMTAWAQTLAAPLRLTLSKPGYQTKKVELGTGPHRFVAINPRLRNEYYLLERRYVIELEPEVTTDDREAGSAPAPSMNYVEELQGLADLLERGTITQAEFEALKARVMTRAVEGPAAESPAVLPAEPSASTLVVTSARAPPKLDSHHVQSVDNLRGLVEQCPPRVELPLAPAFAPVLEASETSHSPRPLDPRSRFVRCNGLYIQQLSAWPATSALTASLIVQSRVRFPPDHDKGRATVRYRVVRHEVALSESWEQLDPVPGEAVESKSVSLLLPPNTPEDGLRLRVEVFTEDSEGPQE